MSKINFIARRAIEKGRKDGKSCRKIAQEIGVSKSAVAYEINRYKLPNGNYYAELAHWMSQKISRGRNQKRRKFLQKKLLLIIDKLLRDGRSPKDISLYLKKMYPDQKDLQISHESIYKLAYNFANLAGNPCRSWYRYLLRKRKKRQFRHQPEPYRRCYRRSIHAMLPGLKKAFGVWQMDIMYIKKGYILVVVETVSKKVMAKLVYDLKAETIQKACRLSLVGRAREGVLLASSRKKVRKDGPRSRCCPNLRLILQCWVLCLVKKAKKYVRWLVVIVFLLYTCFLFSIHFFFQRFFNGLESPMASLAIASI